MTGAAIAIEDVADDKTILSVKERVFAVNRELPVHRQRLMYRPGPHGISPLADDETLGGAGVARDGSAELDVLLEPLTQWELSRLGPEVLICHMLYLRIDSTLVPCSESTSSACARNANWSDVIIRFQFDSGFSNCLSPRFCILFRSYH